MDLSMIQELNKFSFIEFHDEPHKYYVNEKEMVSATKLIGFFKKEFKTQEIATKYAEDNDREVEHVIDEWDYKKDFSIIKGHLIHKYAENYIARKILPYPEEEMLKTFGYDIMKPVFDKLTEHFHKFYNDSKNNLLPIKSEWVIGDAELGVTGCLDQLYYNQKSGEIEIWDWKSNRQMRTKNEFNNRFKYPLEHLDMCEFNTYSLQLSLYRYIVQKNTNLKIGNCYLVWIYEKNDTYKVIKCKDMTEEIEAVIKYSKKYQWI